MSMSMSMVNNFPIQETLSFSLNELQYSTNKCQTINGTLIFDVSLKLLHPFFSMVVAAVTKWPEKLIDLIIEKKVLTIKKNNLNDH